MFPDSEGKVAQTGELCRDAAGRRLFGGHSCRVAGSRYWVAQGLEIMQLQVFARSGSQVILRYIADAPLESAVCFNRHQPTSSSTVFESKSQDAGENVLARKLRRFMSEAEAEFHELRELVKAGATSAQPSFVHNTVSSVWHRVASGRQFVAGVLACSRFVKSCRQSRRVRLSVAGAASEISGRELIRQGDMEDDPSAWLHDSLGQTVEKTIEMFKEQSRVAPSVAIALTLFPPGWCSTVVVESGQPEVVSVTTRVDWGGWWAQ